MNLRTMDAQDTERAVARLDDPRAATTTLHEERSDLNRYLALRMNMRGERAMTTAGVSWI
jgi:hypothetical protein